MSRLPFQIGLYFALTGEYMDHDRMSRLGFLNGMTDENIPNKQFRKKLTEANLFFRNRIPYDTFDEEHNQVQSDILNTEWEIRHKAAVKFEQHVIFSNKRNFFTKFAHNQYKLALIDYANSIEPNNSFSDKRHSIINYFQMRQQRPLSYL